MCIKPKIRPESATLLKIPILVLGKFSTKIPNIKPLNINSSKNEELKYFKI
jgi:hypothetical protein